MPRKKEKRQQAAVTTYLALQIVPGRRYAESEVDWLVCTSFARAAKVPDCATIRKEFARLGLLERAPPSLLCPSQIPCLRLAV